MIYKIGETNKIFEFIKSINKLEDQLFGFRLFYEWIKLTDKKKNNILFVKKYYSFIMKHGQPIVEEAKELLERVKRKETDIMALDKFDFVRLLKLVSDKLESCSEWAKSYGKLYPGRDREKPLTLEEYKVLQDDVHKLFFQNKT